MYNNSFKTTELLYDGWLNSHWFNADPRVEDWFLMSSVWPQTYTIASYIFFVTALGPRLMENQKAFDLKNVMFFYNVGVVGLSLYMIYEFLMSGWATGYSFRCEIVDYSNSPLPLRMAGACWLFYFSKFIEMLDTVFFVLRKKNKQVSFLHVFHHSIMPFTWWFGVKFAPGGHVTFHCMVNCSVHVMMYSYYALAALGPAYQKYLWWKKYMTSIQLVQFVMTFVHIVQIFFMEDCAVLTSPDQFFMMLGNYLTALYAALFMILFLNFYFHAYIKGKRLPKHPLHACSLQNDNSIHSNTRSHSQRMLNKDD